MAWFEGFEAGFHEVNGQRLFARSGGQPGGPPLLLLHGYPQTHLAWHRLAPLLAGRFACVMPDLPGYGASEGPAPDGGRTSYAKREIAVRIDVPQLEFHEPGRERRPRVLRPVERRGCEPHVQSERLGHEQVLHAVQVEIRALDVEQPVADRRRPRRRQQRQTSVGGADQHRHRAADLMTSPDVVAPITVEVTPKAEAK